MTERTASPVLVFGDDGAESSERAWQWITSHSWPGWTVEVLTADADATHVDWGRSVTLEPWDTPWDRDSSAVRAEQVRFLTAAADPRALLADATADLMVLGIKPHGPLAAVVAGSTTEWLLHHPPSPLAIIRRPDRVSKVLVAADGSVHAQRAVETFASLPLAATATVTVLSVDDGRTDVSAAERARDALTGRVADITLTTATGRPTDAILETIESSEAELVVMGTRGLTGWRRLRLGSTASAVVRSTASDSLVACVDTTDMSD